VESSKGLSEILVVIPVINEVRNLEILVPKILKMSNEFKILIIDDDSNDGTADYVSQESSNSKNLFYMRRKGRNGIGSAHVAGLRYAINNDYKYCITMDGDQTHDPLYLTKIKSGLENSKVDLVLTSRFLLDGGLEKWNLIRKILTYLGHLLTIIFLRTSRDLTSGMRGYRVESIDERMLKWLDSSHYEFLPLSYFYYKNLNKNVIEIPIILPNRVYGNSKMNLRLLLTNVWKIITVKNRFEKMQSREDLM
jgi:dolichol-phosphate mannosyltransferase